MRRSAGTGCGVAQEGCGVVQLGYCVAQGGCGVAPRHDVRQARVRFPPGTPPSGRSAGDYYDPDAEDFQGQEKSNSVPTSLIKSDFQSVPLKNLF